LQAHLALEGHSMSLQKNIMQGQRLIINLNVKCKTASVTFMVPFMSSANITCFFTGGHTQHGIGKNLAMTW
jgi:hypothetical protein